MKFVMKITICGLIFFGALLVGHHNHAKAANWPLVQLDQIGSALSGKPVNVYCEDSWLPWESFWAQQGIDGTYIAGFTYPTTGSTLFVSPKICETLHAWFGNEDVGTYHAAQAILVLTHEAMHQRLRSGDEALVECNALKAFPSVATTYFHVAATATQRDFRVVKRHGHRQVHGRTVRWVYTTVVAVDTTVPNPYYTRLVVDAHRWDAAMPVQYHGVTC
jgi:hypothetical protein